MANPPPDGKFGLASVLRAHNAPVTSALRFDQTPYRAWLLVQAVSGIALLLALAAASPPRGADGLLVAWAATMFASLVFLGGGVRGSADLVTVLRTVLLLVWLLVADATGRAALALLAVLGLDLLDGWLARRSATSEAGAVYDMEADQLVVMVMAYAAYARGLPVWVLLLPGLKYVSTLLTSAFGLAAGAPKPKQGDNRRGRLVCASVLIALWLALVPIVPPLLAKTLLAVSAGALMYSFADDLRFLWLHREKQGHAVP